MQKITSNGNVSSLPAPSTTGTPGFFTNGNAAQGIEGTPVSADWLNGVQEELVAVLAAGGQTPDITNNGQLLAAILKLIAVNARPKNVVSHSTHGTYTFTVPAGIYNMRIELRGAGGAGNTGVGNTTDVVDAGGGGGGGGYAEVFLPVVPGGVLSMVVGVGQPYNGTGSSTSVAYTAPGGTSVLIAVANIGAGGTAAPAPGGIGGGGAGGGATLTPGYAGIVRYGSNGTNGIYISNATAIGGIGGTCWGAAAINIATGSNTPGNSFSGVSGGGLPGGGGGGACGGQPGGAGSDGEVLLYY